MEYSDGQFQIKVPFRMYADFESILELIGPVGPVTVTPYRDQKMISRDINIHIPSGWCVHSEFAHGKVEDPLVLYRGKDCVRKFCDHVTGEAHHLYQSFPEKPMEPLTKAQWKDHKKASSCHICLKPVKEGNPKVRDHCHYSIYGMVSTEEPHTGYVTYSIRYHPTFRLYSLTFQDTMLICL